MKKIHFATDRAIWIQHDLVGGVCSASSAGAALQGGCGGVEHPPTRHQLGKSLTSVGKTGLAKDNH